MAGLTKEQRAQREAEKLAGAQEEQNTVEHEHEHEHGSPNLVLMTSDVELYPGAPTQAEVHPAEVENWKSAGWRVLE